MIKIVDAGQVTKILSRKAARLGEAEAVVKPMLEAVKKRGDAAVLEYARQFDGLERKSVRVPEGELAAAAKGLSPEFKAAVKTAAANIRAYAKLQLPTAKSV